MVRKRQLSLLLSILWCLWSLPPVGDSFARTWHIDPHRTGDAPSIRAAILSAGQGDTILVAAGTYHEHDLPLKSGVIILSETRGAGGACLDAEGRGRLFSCEGVDHTARIEGFTLTGGRADGLGTDSMGGAIYCLNSSPMIIHCAFEKNESGHYGGGICCRASSPTITDCTFEDNHADYGGALGLLEDSSPEIRDCRFRRNTADYGGSIDCYSCSPTVADCHFSRNSAFYYGGAVSLRNTPATSFHDCTLTENSARHGGGIYCYASSPDLRDTDFSLNVAQEGGGLYIFYASSPILDRVLFDRNTARNGGGLYCASAAHPSIRGSTFHRNTAEEFGGGMCSDAASPDILSCTFNGNSAPYGAAINCHATSSLTLEKSIVVFGRLGPAVFCQDGRSTIAVNCCDIFGNKGGDWISCLTGLEVRDGNLSLDPLFRSPQEADFRLRDDSPCRAREECGLIGAWE